MGSFIIPLVELLLIDSLDHFALSSRILRASEVSVMFPKVLPATGSYDGTRPGSYGKTLALIHLKGMVGWALRSISCSPDYRLITVNVLNLHTGPSAIIL